MAFAGQMGGYNPAAMAAPPAFVAKGSAAGETDVGAAGEAAAATIAALSMAGSPAATRGVPGCGGGGEFGARAVSRGAGATGDGGTGRRAQGAGGAGRRRRSKGSRL